MLQDELEEPRWECFLGAQGQALPKGLEKQAERPQQRQPQGKITGAHQATFPLLSGREAAILATQWSFARLMPETLLLRESSSGTVMSHMLGSGESHAPRSLKKIKTVPGGGR